MKKNSFASVVFALALVLTVSACASGQSGGSAGRSSSTEGGNADIPEEPVYIPIPAEIVGSWEMSLPDTLKTVTINADGSGGYGVFDNYTACTWTWDGTALTIDDYYNTASVTWEITDGWLSLTAVPGSSVSALLGRLDFIIRGGMEKAVNPAPEYRTPEGSPGMVFTPIDNGRAYSASRGEASGAIVIPPFYQGLPVTAIADEGFSRSGMRSIAIPNTVTVIGDRAFEVCLYITSLTIPASVRIIGDRAFENNASLTSVTIPATVQRVGVFAFNYCVNMTSATVVSQATSVGGGAFNGNPALTALNVPAGSPSGAAGAPTPLVFTELSSFSENPFGDDFRSNGFGSLVYGNNRYLLGRNNWGSADGIGWAYSTNNGAGWTKVPLGTRKGFGARPIGYGDGKFVMHTSGGPNGASGFLIYSSDGVNWNEAAQTAFYRDLTVPYEIIYAGGKLVAVGTEGIIGTSTDGVTWTTAAALGSSPFNKNLHAVAWGNNRYVTGGFGGMLGYSDDGVSWTPVRSPFGEDKHIEGIAWGNGRFIAVERDGGIAYSTDGVNWTVSAHPLDNFSRFTGDISGFPGRVWDRFPWIVFSNGRFIIQGTLDNANRLAYSADGVNWELVGRWELPDFFVLTGVTNGKVHVIGYSIGFANGGPPPSWSIRVSD